MNIGVVVLGFITIIIGVVLHAQLAPTVIDAVDTDSGEPLENASAAAKAMYSIEELVYAMLGILFVVGGGIGILKGMGVPIMGKK